jgi:hypothetical protein
MRSRAFVAWPRLALGLWCAGILLATPVLAADPAYLADMPSTDKVLAKIQGSDPFDTSARQYAALSRLESMMLELEGDRVAAGTTTSAEKALGRSYHDGYLKLQADMLNSLPEDQRPVRADTKYGQWRALIDSYCCKGGTAKDPYVNPEFSDTMLKALFSDSFRASYAPIHAAAVANQKQATAPQPLPVEQAPGPDTSRIPIAFGLVMLNVILFGASGRGRGRRKTDR